MEDIKIIEEWLENSDYSDAKNGRVFLVALFRDFICYCAKNGYDVPPITDRKLSEALVSLGYKKIQARDGMVFVMVERQK